MGSGSSSISSDPLRVPRGIIRHGGISPAVQWTLGSACAVVVLGYLTMALPTDARRCPDPVAEVRVYCASGVARPVEQAVAFFCEQRGVMARIERSGGSGELFGQVTMEAQIGKRLGADLLISADADLLERGRATGVISEVFPLAVQRPVIVTYVDSGYTAVNLRQMVALGRQHDFGIATEEAAIGRLTRNLASGEGILESLLSRRKLETENVMQLAQAVASHALEAAVIWDTTVGQVNRQYGREVLCVVSRLEEASADGEAWVALGIVKHRRLRPHVRELAEFLAGRDGGLPFFRTAGFALVSESSGDAPSAAGVDPL